MDPATLHRHLLELGRALDQGRPVRRCVVVGGVLVAVSATALPGCDDWFSTPIYAAVITTEGDCDDNLDDDADGLTDCDDPDCATDPRCPQDTGPDVETSCGDGVDNDDDFLIDCHDPDCDAAPECVSDTGAPAVEDTCDDGIDNDGDGYYDCDDTDCADDPACGGADLYAAPPVEQ